MGTTQLKMLKLLLSLAFAKMCIAQDMSLSVFTVTSKTMTMQWSGQSGASFYKITATPLNSPAHPATAQFSSNYMMGTVMSLSPNTNYNMELEAMDNAHKVIGRATVDWQTAPAVPSIEKAYSKHSDSITVEFTEVTGATSYILSAEDLQTGEYHEIVVERSPGTVVKLQPYTSYILEVRSVNLGGRSQPSDPVGHKTIIMAPQLNTSSPSNESILVTWPPVKHAATYMLLVIQQDSDTRFNLTTNNTMAILEYLKAGTSYCITGMALDAEGRSGDELTKCQQTRPESPNVTATHVTQGRSVGILVYWLPVQGADTYIATTSNGLSCITNNTTFCMIPGDCGQISFVTVIASNTAGPSSPSEPAEYLTYPCPVKNIWVEEPTAGNCSVVWEEVPLAEFYMTFIKRDDGSEEFCNTTETTCLFFCMCGYTYLTTVFPANQAGSNHFANVRNYTTIPCCPEDVEVKLISTETLEITWLPVKGAELYETTASQNHSDIHCNDTAPICVLSDLPCNTNYSVVVTPCSELRGCNRTCTPHTHETAPCAPEILNITQSNVSSYRVFFTTPNTQITDYTITAVGHYKHYCNARQSPCELTELPCGSTYDVMAVATTAVGQSLPGYSKPLETGPCCPTSVNVTQVTEAMTNVTWSASHGARSYITTLMSKRGHAKCHTLDVHCLMGCITCGTNYSVTLEAISITGHKSECKYRGVQSNACCPKSVKLYRRANNTLRVYWRSLSSQIQDHAVELYGTGANYTCIAAAGNTYCDIEEETCGDVYTVMAAPIGHDGIKVSFCQPRTYSVPCPGSNAGIVISRGRRSVA